jgi:hypothetical protein
MSLWKGAIMNKKVNPSLLLIALAVFVFGIAGEGYAQEHSLTVINTGAGKGTVTATSDVKTPEISLSTDKLEFDFSTGRRIVLKTLVISNIGTGNLIVSVSGLDGTDFRILGRSAFTVKPGRKHNLMVYVLSASVLQATEGMGTDERVLGAGASDGSDDLEAMQVKTLGAGKKTPTNMSLKTNDPNHPEKLIELTPLVPLAESATLNIEGAYHFATCGDELIDLTETGEIQLNFLYLPDKGYYNIACEGGGGTCKGVTNISGAFPCKNGCTVRMRQNNIQWIISGKLSKDKAKLTLDVFHATEPEGSYTFTCPDNPPQSAPWSWVKDSFWYKTITMEYKQGAKQTVSMAPLGEKTYTLSSITQE